ncbi:MAG: GntP family permease [Planctomycetia bacterium]|nr:GntP family permease [Planctomycetia bacterium]
MYPDPLLALLFGLLTVILLITVLRVHPFLALLAAALVVSFSFPILESEKGDPDLPRKVVRVAEAFGVMAGKIGILIVMGTIIGICMTESRAADRIIQKICRIFGVKRIPIAFIGSGYLLSIPVFYDATFYLLLPLAKSIYRLTRKNYLLYLLCIGFGATISHTLIPPTPGPLVVSQEMGISLGIMILVGIMTGLCMIPFALGIAYFINGYMPNPELQTDEFDRSEDQEQSFDAFLAGSDSGERYPSFFASIIPIFLPVLLIAGGAVIFALEKQGNIPIFASHTWIRDLCALISMPETALGLSALVSVFLLQSVRKLRLRELEEILAKALESAGIIILITAAGGAFGSMLRQSGVGTRIQEFAGSGGSLSGISILLLAFGIAAMIKTAQGSSTTAMITVAGIFAAMKLDAAQLGFHPAYLAITIGLGSCVTGWMNDSGFCIFSRMSGIRETDALKTWTVGLVLLGLSGLLVVICLSSLFPLIS